MLFFALRAGRLESERRCEHDPQEGKMHLVAQLGRPETPVTEARTRRGRGETRELPSLVQTFRPSGKIVGVYASGWRVNQTLSPHPFIHIQLWATPSLHTSKKSMKKKVTLTVTVGQQRPCMSLSGHETVKTANTDLSSCRSMTCPRVHVDGKRLNLTEVNHAGAALPLLPSTMR